MKSRISHCWSGTILVVLHFAMVSEAAAQGMCKWARPTNVIMDGHLDYLEHFVQECKCPDCKKIPTSCKLTHRQHLPEITVIGENHRSESSIAVRKDLFRLAEDGRIQLLTEVTLAGMPALPWMGKKYWKGLYPELRPKNVHPMEAPITHTIIRNYTMQNRSIWKGSIDNDDLAARAIAVFSSPTMRSAYENLRTNPKYRGAIESLDAFLAGLAPVATSEKRGTPEIGDIKEKLSQSLPNKYRGPFFDALHAQFIEDMRKNYSKELDGIDLPFLLTEEDSNNPKIGWDEAKDAGTLMSDLKIKLRDREFAAAIGNLICRQEASSVPIFVLMGDAHSEGVKSLLKGLTGDRLPIQYYQSYIPGADIKNALSRVPALRTGIQK